MQAGNLRHRLAIQRYTESADSRGELIKTWTTYRTVWGEAMTSNTGNREFYAAQKLYAETSVVFRVRYNATITAQDRVVFLGKTYQIINVNHVQGRTRELLLIAKEVI